MNRLRAPILAAVSCAALFAVVGEAGADPWIDHVRSFEPGTFAGFGADKLPGVVLGGPEGLGLDQGSVDVVSLGNGGRIVVSFDNNAVVDGDGDDLVIFENPFFGGALLFAEYAFVEVSANGRRWVQFPYDAVTGAGLAGRAPVMANSENGLDPLDAASGGDRFDLADVGLDYVRFVRITDAGSLIDDPGNHSFAGTKGGFDLDAAGAIHSVQLGCVVGTLTIGGLPAAGQRVKLRSGKERHGHFTRSDGGYRFCRLRPGLDYDVSVHVPDVGDASGRAFVDETQNHVRVDLFLP